ncbi:hypothetical protein C0J52_26300, partial [Blattella germanica]
ISCHCIIKLAVLLKIAKWSTNPSLSKCSGGPATLRSLILLAFLFGCSPIARRVRFLNAGLSFSSSPVCYNQRLHCPETTARTWE